MHRAHRLLLLVLTLLAPWQGASAELRVVSCEPEWAALVQELGGEAVRVSSATTAQQDVHHIQARPSLIAKVRRADLLVCTGAGLEAGWLPLLQRKAGNRRVLPGAGGFLAVSSLVPLLDKREQVDRSGGDVHAEGNPHFHLEPGLYPTIARALSAALADLDGENSDYYQGRLDDFLARWQVALERWRIRAQPLRGRALVVHHDAWPYLFRWLELRRAAVLEPLPGVPPSSTHLASLQRQLEGREVLGIVHAGYQSDRAARWLAGRSGLPVAALPFTVGGSEQADDLFGLFDDTLTRLLDLLP